jgi:hypothetical protein
MTTPEANPRLNVRVPMTANPIGNFAIAATIGSPTPIEAGTAIVALSAVGSVSAAAVEVVSQFLNLDVPRGEISAVVDAGVKADGALSFAPAAMIGGVKIAAPGAESGTSLELGTPKFTY